MGIDQKIIAHDQTAPRYTSYPTAPHFRPDFPEEIYKEWLAALDQDGPLSLYLHIPFCDRLCYYCGCHTHITKNYDHISRYLQTLRQEIKLVRQAIGGKRPVSQIHFGGGSPSIMRAHDFEELLALLKDEFSFLPDIEIALEADPRQLDAAQVKILAQNGVNRISLGVQDFDEEVLALVNRPQGYDITRTVIEACRSEGIDAINCDLMYGLPGQTEEKAVRTFERMMELSPSRVAYFGYAHVPWMKKHMRLLPEDRLPDAKGRLALYRTGERLMKEAGYAPVGIDHFTRADDPMLAQAREGVLHRNFQGYTTDRARSLLGFGASAIGYSAGGYVQNAPQLNDYKACVDSGHLPVKRGHVLDDEDRARSAVIMDLMCHLSYDFAAPDVPPDADKMLAAARPKLAPLSQAGFCKLEGSRLTISPEARLMARLVCTCFDSYYEPGAQARHSQAV